MDTVKRDISGIEASYELSSLPLYRCSHQFQNVSFTGSWVLERNGATLTKSTPLDKYLAHPKEDVRSWYLFVCRLGKVPVISGSNMRATWPLTEDLSRSMLQLHWPNWRQITDIGAQYDSQQPEWMDLLQPIADFDDVTSDFTYDDGGPDFDWSLTSNTYPDNYGVLFFTKSEWYKRRKQHLILPNIDVNSLNEDQRFAFSLVMETLIKYQVNPVGVEKLRVIISGTAGSGKSYLIQSLVRAIKLLFNFNKAVQVLCPTGSSANLISSRTIHSFLKIPTSTKATEEMSSPEGVTGETLQFFFSRSCMSYS